MINQSLPVPPPRHLPISSSSRFPSRPCRLVVRLVLVIYRLALPSRPSVLLLRLVSLRRCSHPSRHRIHRLSSHPLIYPRRYRSPLPLVLLHRRIAFSSPAALFISPHHHYPMRKRADENGASFVSSNGTLIPPSPRPTMTDDNRERNTQPRDERNETANDEPPPWP